MPNHDNPNTRLVSTKWVKKVSILTGPPRPVGTASTKSTPSQPPLRARDPRKPIYIELAYRGGSVAWWEVKARGRTWRFPGYTAIADVMQRVNAVWMWGPQDQDW